MKELDNQVHQIIIVKRKSSSHDEHHGGVWKIAFADFMTAMMAFFLVLWIVNSTSKETQSAIARHFNPIKISDTTPAPRGLREGSDIDFDATLDEGTKESSKAAKKNRELAPGSTMDPDHSKNDRDQRTEDLIQDEKTNQSIPMADFDGKSIPDLEAEFRSSPTRLLDRLSLLAGRKSREDAVAAREAASLALDSKLFVDPFVGGYQLLTRDKTTSTSPPPRLGIAEAISSIDSDTSIRFTKISLLNSIFRKTIDSNPVLKIFDHPIVESESGTIYVSIADSKTVSLFPIGSAVPTPRAFLLISEIGKAISVEKSKITIEGHTDGRIFRSEGYNNWNLSTNRAIFAYHILRRAGVSDDRFVRIEGHADKNLRNKENSMAPDNRRIRIGLIE